MHPLTWTQAANQCKLNGENFALVTLLGCTGSTPRESASKMVISPDHTWGSIGGGQLEFTVTMHARHLLAQTREAQEIQHYPLGASLGQCCGGSVTVLFEVFIPIQFSVAVFGAGHVAQALVPLLSALPFKILWTDERASLFPEALPPNVTRRVCDQPEQEISSLPPGTSVLILTHSHQTDFRLCLEALQRDDLPYIGLIGSRTKARRFHQRLLQRGYTEAAISRIECPAGLPEVPGKLPMEVAVSLAGRLIARKHQTLAGSPASRGVSWQTLKESFQREIDGTDKGYRLSLTPDKET